MIKSHTIPLHPAQDMHRPFVQRDQAVYAFCARTATGSTVTVSQCQCSSHPYLVISPKVQEEREWQFECPKEKLWSASFD